MFRKTGLTAVLSGLMLVASVFFIGACGGSPAPASPTPVPGRPGGGALVNSDSVVTVKIESITGQSTGYPWKLEVLVENTIDVDGLPNPVKDSVNKLVSAVTDENMAEFKVGDVVNARMKYVGDVKTPGGVSLFIYKIALEIKP